jgi:hypothetical protein
MRPRLSEFSRGEGPTDAAMSAFEASLTQLCRAGTRVRLYINPTHALTLDVLYWGGKWAAMEEWQADLVRMLARRRDAACDVTLQDFSGYNSVTSESIPQITQRNFMVNYWEASHYRANVGRMILAGLFGAGESSLPADFGTPLDQATLPRHLNELRAARDRYHLAHPQETAFARSVAEADRGKSDPRD